MSPSDVLWASRTTSGAGRVVLTQGVVSGVDSPLTSDAVVAVEDGEAGTDR